jgi:hypothetical protein
MKATDNAEQASNRASLDRNPINGAIVDDIRTLLCHMLNAQLAARQAQEVALKRQAAADESLRKLLRAILVEIDAHEVSLAQQFDIVVGSTDRGVST